MRNKIKLYKKRALVLLINIILWWCVSGVIVLGVSMFAMVPLYFGVSLSDELLGTDFFSPFSSFFDWIKSSIMSIMAFFGVLGGIYELFYPKSSTRTTTL